MEEDGGRDTLRDSVNTEALPPGVTDEMAGACAHHDAESRRRVSQDATRRELSADDDGGREATEGCQHGRSCRQTG